jgi:hypothetical protein
MGYGNKTLLLVVLLVVTAFAVVSLVKSYCPPRHANPAPAVSFNVADSFDRPRVYGFSRSCGERCAVNVFDATFCRMNAALHTVTCQFPDERQDRQFPDGMTDRMPYLLYHHE